MDTIESLSDIELSDSSIAAVFKLEIVIYYSKGGESFVEDYF